MYGHDGRCGRILNYESGSHQGTVSRSALSPAVKESDWQYKRYNMFAVCEAERKAILCAATTGIITW